MTGRAGHKEGRKEGAELGGAVGAVGAAAGGMRPRRTRSQAAKSAEMLRWSMGSNGELCLRILLSFSVCRALFARCKGHGARAQEQEVLTLVIKLQTKRVVLKKKQKERKKLPVRNRVPPKLSNFIAKCLAFFFNCPFQQKQKGAVKIFA